MKRAIFFWKIFLRIALKQKGGGSPLQYFPKFYGQILHSVALNL